MPTGGRRDPAWWLGCAALGAYAALRFHAYAFFEPDDLYIYLRFVRNLLLLGEPSFNPGEPTYGFTSALWLGVLTAGTGAIGDPFLAAKLTSAFAAAGSVLLVSLLVRELGGARGVALLAGLAWASNAWLARWSCAGLEGPLSACVVLWVALLYARARRRERPPLLAALVSGVAPLVRPELLGWPILLVAHHAWVSRRSAASGRLTVALLASLPFALAAAAAWIAFGRVLPNTAEAKGFVIPALAAMLPALLRILAIVASTSAIEGVLVVLFTILALRRGDVSRAWTSGDPRGLFLLAGWSIGLVGLYSVRGVDVYTRYLLMLLPVVVVGGFVVLSEWWARGGVPRLAVFAVTIAIVAQNLALERLRILPATIVHQRSIETVNVPLGRWLAANTPPGTVVGALDIGAIGYRADRPILDLVGLVSPELIQYRREGRVGEYVARVRPGYVIDIAPEELRLTKAGWPVRLTPLLTCPFHKMFVSSTAPLYYTLYRVGDADGEAPAGWGACEPP